ncbi:MAG: molybdenum cofactor guanylyltransferase [Rectinemataceae bacterium]
MGATRYGNSAATTSLPEKLPLTAAILNGGASRRFGGVDKQAILLNGTPLVGILVERLQNLASEIIVAGKPHPLLESFGIRTYQERGTSIGPLGGLSIALREAVNPWVLLLAVDMPFVSRILTETLWNARHEGEILAFRVQGMVQPFHALYHRDIVQDLDICLESGCSRSLWRFMQTRRLKILNIEDAMHEEAAGAFVNFNDWAALSRYAAAPNMDGSAMLV